MDSYGRAHRRYDRARRRYDRARRRETSVFRGRRLALAGIAAGLVVAAAGLVTLRPAARHTHHASHQRKAADGSAASPFEREPRPSQNSTAPRPPWAAAVRFVRDYSAWEAGRLARLPADDATERVIRVLEYAGRHGLGVVGDPMGSVRIGAAGAGRYFATSAVGNFLIGRHGSRWLVVSVPGD